jgi:hypothetical protein
MHDDGVVGKSNLPRRNLCAVFEHKMRNALVVCVNDHLADAPDGVARAVMHEPAATILFAIDEIVVVLLPTKALKP